MRKASRWPQSLVGALPFVFLLVMLAAPVSRLLYEGGTATLTGMAGALWLDPYLRWRIAWTFIQAALTCLATILLGVPVAWVLSRLDFPGRRLVLRLLMLPFVVPTLVAALGVLALWGPRGLLSHVSGMHLQDTPWLLLYGNLFFNLCVVVRATVDALNQVSATRVAAARTLGATPWRAFWRVEWPSIVPWLASALCLVFLYCFAGFGLALILGGQHFATMEVEIWTLVAHELKLAEAGALSIIMLLLTGGVALAYAHMEQRLAVPSRTDRIALRQPRCTMEWLSVGAALLVLFIFCAAPLLAIVLRALLAGFPAWTVVVAEETLLALGNTLRFTASALILATLLGLTHAFAVRSSSLWRAAAFLPFVASPVTVAFGLLLLYPAWIASLPLLVAAYALLAYPFVAKSVSAALDSLPIHLEQASRTLGATPWRTFRRVTLPLIAPALRRGMAFAAATSLGEFAVTLFLSRPEWTTLTTLIYQHLGQAGATRLDSAFILASLLTVLALLVFLAIDPHSPDSREPIRRTRLKESAHASA